MKIRKLFLISAIPMCFLLMTGSVLASYSVKDSARNTGIRILIKEAKFYLNSVSEENKLELNTNGLYESEEITSSYGETFQVVDENGTSVGDSYVTTTEGKYKISFDLVNKLTSVDVIEKKVYFNFLPMSNGGQNGRVWDQFYCYAYEDGTDDKNATWPGQVMTAVNETGLYKLSIDGDFDTVIFNNGRADTSSHTIQTADLTYDITKPQFGCTSNTDLTEYEVTATPSINQSSSFDYYLHTSYNSWAERSKAYGFEKVADNSQYLLRCYLSAGSELGVKDNSSGWWGLNNMGSWDGDVNFSGKNGNISVNNSDWYNIYFQPNNNKIYISRG